jgi:hypothetical protein
MADFGDEEYKVMREGFVDVVPAFMRGRPLFHLPPS